jgi:hypothetical protein
MELDPEGAHFILMVAWVEWDARPGGSDHLVQRAAELCLNRATTKARSSEVRDLAPLASSYCCLDAPAKSGPGHTDQVLGRYRSPQQKSKCSCPLLERSQAML